MNKCTEPAKGGDDAFADSGLELAKSTIVQRIASIISARKLTQVQAAEILSIDQPKVSLLLRGCYSGYSTDRLLRFLTALDQNVELIVKAKPRAASHPASVKVIAD